ncbi:MAG: DUF2029 domain-containing protein [Chloroflexi bacterium]|nr:DUF2029 domain-containing protein [Chloroflexota bacterium]
MRLGPGRLVAAALPVVAVVVVIAVVSAAVWSSAQAGTLGFDFLSYDVAVRRFFAGGVLYDQSFDYTGAFGLFYYPPPFVLLAAPLAALDPTVAAWLWSGFLVGAFALGIALLPVDTRTRWLVLLLGGISWPLVYAIKLGQVGPILLVTFTIGWRWMERPWRLGVATAIGTAIKIQPALVFAWALLTGRRRAVVAGLAALGVFALLATLVAGPSSWVDQATLLARVSKPIDTPHNMTPGRVAFELGLGVGLAWAIQITNWMLVGVLVLVAIYRCRPVASYLAVAVATQLVSPILWDHYALLLLLPVAWLLSEGRRWAVLIPLATSIVLVGGIPPIVYPTAFWVTLLWVVRAGWIAAPGTLPAQASPGAGAILVP